MSEMFLSAARILAAVFAAIVLFTVFLYFYQEKMIFYPQPASEARRSEIRKFYKNTEEVSITASDGTILNGWLVKASSAPSPLIIYFGGNAEEVSSMIGETYRLKDWSMALINYRGYGMSGGKPGEKKLFSDALYIYDYFAKRSDVNPENIVVWGRSLGTGVAVYLASQRKTECVILTSPYDSLLNVAKNIYPYLPVSLIMKHRFDSGRLVSSLSLPALMLAAERDTTITLPHSEALFKKWNGKRIFKIIPGEDHNSLSGNELYWKYILDFLDSIKSSE
ncbi:MAG TPA: alpha/beta hydrolase [bacterium]|nr:alpha/beta hydrolase [bacterium]